MKTSYNVIMLILLFLTGISARAVGGNFEKVLADKKFDVDNNALLSIQHKYGNVTCKNWKQQIIAVKIIAMVDANSLDAAEKIFNRIDFDLSGNRSQVSFESNSNDRLFNGNRNNLTIRVEVMMPEAVRLEVHNQFGNCYIEKVRGTAEVQTEYGSLEIDALINERNEVDIDFGDGRIGFMQGGDVEISYSPLSLGEAGNITVESSYSDIKIGKVSQIEIESEGGNVEIGEVEKAELSAKFSECTITVLGRSLRAETEYGALTVVKVSPEFELLEIENAFGSTQVTFDSGASFRFEFDVEMGTIDFDFPEPHLKFSRRENFMTGSSFAGTTGSNPQKAMVSIESSYGSVVLGFNK